MKEFKNRKYPTFRSLITKVLNPFELDLIYNRYGLIAEKKTLEEMGNLYKLTRERVRQIENRALKKIRESIDNGELDQNLINKISEYAECSKPVAYIKDISDEYINQGLLYLIIKMYPDLFSLYEDKRIEQPFLILSANHKSISNLIGKLLVCLNQQEGFVKITEISSYFNCKEDIVLNLKNISVEQDYIAIKSNKKIFKSEIISLIEDTLEKSGKPMHVKEIIKKSGLSLNQVRGCILRSKEAVNIGPSIYALAKWGYIRGHIEDVIEHYLKLANEPMTLKQIVSLVAKQRLYKPKSVMVALSINSRFKRVGEGIYGLENWNYEEYNFSKKTYEIDAKDAVLKVMNSEPTLTRDIIKKIKNKFGDKANQTKSTIYAALNNLVNKGIIKKTEKKFSIYYYK